MNWRAAFLVTLGIAVLAAGYLAYAWFDQAVSHSYLSDDYQRTRKDLATLAAAFPRDRYSQKEVLAVLRRNNPKALIVQTPCAIHQDGLRFEFDNQGALVRIDTSGEYSPDTKCRPSTK